MLKTVTLTDDARAVLVRAAIDPNLVALPAGQLERPVYDAVAKFLTALGGKWNRAAQGFHFPDGTADVRAAIDAGAAVDQKKTMEQFFTPEAVAERMADMAGIRSGSRVLEPSAGAGALVRAALARGADVDAVELDDKLWANLALIGTNQRFRAFHADFLKWTPLPLIPGNDPVIYDFVMMNPPFSRGQDMHHVLRAFEILRPGGTLVAIMSPHWAFATDGQSNAFRVALSRLGDDNYDWEELPPGTFKESGTSVNTGILTMVKPL